MWPFAPACRAMRQLARGAASTLQRAVLQAPTSVAWRASLHWRFGSTCTPAIAITQIHTHRRNRYGSCRDGEGGALDGRAMAKGPGITLLRAS